MIYYDGRNYQALPVCDSYFVEYANDAGDSLGRMVEISRGECQKELIDHMESMEVETMPSVADMDLQTEIRWFMRPYLLDFLIEAHTAFSLLPETLFLTVNLMDRYCSQCEVSKRYYQLLGCSAMLIAAKYGEKRKYVPTLRELAAMCCGLYDEDMFIQMELNVLKKLDWVVGHPSVESFLQLAFQNLEQPDPVVESMARYLAEISLYHPQFLSVRPSVMARTSLAMSYSILGRIPPRSVRHGWTGEYDTSLDALLDYTPSETLAFKYSSPKFGCVSTILKEYIATPKAIPQQPPAPPTPLQYEQVYEITQSVSFDYFNALPMVSYKSCTPCLVGYSCGYAYNIWDSVRGCFVFYYACKCRFC